MPGRGPGLHAAGEPALARAGRASAAQVTAGRRASHCRSGAQALSSATSATEPTARTRRARRASGSVRSGASAASATFGLRARCLARSPKTVRRERDERSAAHATSLVERGARRSSGTLTVVRVQHFVGAADPRQLRAVHARTPRSAPEARDRGPASPPWRSVACAPALCRATRPRAANTRRLSPPWGALSGSAIHCRVSAGRRRRVVQAARASRSASAIFRLGRPIVGPPPRRSRQLGLTPPARRRRARQPGDRWSRLVGQERLGARAAVARGARGSFTTPLPNHPGYLRGRPRQGFVASEFLASGAADPGHRRDRAILTGFPRRHASRASLFRAKCPPQTDSSARRPRRDSTTPGRRRAADPGLAIPTTCERRLSRDRGRRDIRRADGVRRRPGRISRQRRAPSIEPCSRGIRHAGARRVEVRRLAHERLRQAVADERARQFLDQKIEDRRRRWSGRLLRCEPTTRFSARSPRPTSTRRRARSRPGSCA